MTIISDKETIQRFISEKLIFGRMVDADENLLLGGLLDSMAVVTLMLFLEEQFDLSIPPQDVTIINMASVDAMAVYLDKRRGEAA